MFFFEKKNQKTFAPRGASPDAHHHAQPLMQQWKKSFCFCARKNILMPTGFDIDGSEARKRVFLEKEEKTFANQRAHCCNAKPL